MYATRLLFGRMKAVGDSNTAGMEMKGRALKSRNRLL